MKILFKTVDAYINAFPLEIQEKLNAIKEIIFENAPDATESISYGMPTYKTHKKPLVYFAAYPKHIGFYATTTGQEVFADDLKSYKQGKGSIQFPMDVPLPVVLITRIVKFRIQENEAEFKKMNS